MNINGCYLAIFIEHDLVCGRFSQFTYFAQEIRAFPEDRTGMGSSGEIRGGVHKQLSHSNVGSKMVFKSMKRKKKKKKKKKKKR